MITKSQIKFIQGLYLKKNRIKYKSFIVEGEKNVLELLKSNYKVIELYATSSWKYNDTIVDVCSVTNNELSRISKLKTPNKVVAVVKIPDITPLAKSGVILVLDSISDPGNLGTIIRLCDWFGIKQIVCSQNTVDLYNPKVISSCMGSVFRVTVRYKNLKDYLSKVNTDIYAASMSGDDLKDIRFPKDMHLVLGNESSGISDDIRHFINHNVTIGRKGSEIDSLNVAMATAIFLYKLCD